jgi:preprotein translocase subunit SecF
MAFIEIVKKTNIDFIGLRKKAFILSFVLVGLGLLAFVMVLLGRANESVDFTGGTALQIRFSAQVPIHDLRVTLLQGGINDVQIQEVTGTRDFLIKTKLADTAQEKTTDKVSKILSASFKDKKFEILSANMVGASVGKELKKDAVYAIFFAMLCIVAYIWWRFTFIFGVAAVIATFHDVLAMLGLFYLLGLEMNILFITALLTVAGYSLTDTVVVFDRIRENMGKMKSRDEFGGVINRSINEVLSRTLITSLTVLLVLAALLALGGEVLFEFSLALFIGVLVGTYSSIFVASPLVYVWRKRAA